MAVIFLSDLAPRYRKVLEAILDGVDRPRDMADRCGISRGTMKKYLHEMREAGYLQHVRYGKYVPNAQVIR